MEHLLAIEKHVGSVGEDSRGQGWKVAMLTTWSGKARGLRVLSRVRVIVGWVDWVAEMGAYAVGSVEVEGAGVSGSGPGVKGCCTGSAGWAGRPWGGIANSFLVDSPQPANISYMWNFGSLLGRSFSSDQNLSLVFLAMHYTPSVDLAFQRVEHIMRDEHYGWLIRYLHAFTASFFFLFFYRTRTLDHTNHHEQHCYGQLGVLF